MLQQKNIIFIAGGSIAALLLLLSTVLLFTGVSKLSDTKKKLGQAEKKLEGFYKRDPFPSKENVEREKENVEVFDEWFSRLLVVLTEHDLGEVMQSPSLLMRLLGDKKNELLNEARQSGTVLPDDFAFGFSRYFGTDAPLPAPGDVAKLNHQLIIAESVCKLFYKEGVTAIHKIERQEFEVKQVDTKTPVRRWSTTTSAKPEKTVEKNVKTQEKKKPEFDISSVYTKLPFSFEIEVKEKVLRSILNELARDDLFIVVTKMSLTAKGKSLVVAQPREVIRGGAGGDDSDVAGEEVSDGEKASSNENLVPPRNLRLVSGGNLERPLLVTMEMDVYTFLKSENVSGNDGK